MYQSESLQEAPMGRDDWFRNNQWNSEIEAIFRQRLHRARKKSQYLRIQANYLAESYPQVALRLLEQYFHLEEREDLAQAYVDRAKALTAIGDIDAAIGAYEKALKREQEFPNSLTSAGLDLACLVAKARLKLRFDQALELTVLNNQHHIFPIQRYLAQGARALIFHEMGNQVDAKEAARLAMAAAGQINSNFRYHPNAGLVNETSDEFGNRIAALL
jgi:tetratricopeptide (TPR) repeat protein